MQGGLLCIGDWSPYDLGQSSLNQQLESRLTNALHLPASLAFLVIMALIDLLAILALLSLPALFALHALLEFLYFLIYWKSEKKVNHWLTHKKSRAASASKKQWQCSIYSVSSLIYVTHWRGNIQYSIIIYLCLQIAYQVSIYIALYMFQNFQNCLLHVLCCF